ncbi:MAG: apolipoprotein acyltransferase [Rubripirellula sp.]
MNTESLFQRFHDRSGQSPEQPLDPDSLIGFFQVFRPDGRALADLYDGLELGETDVTDALAERLESLFKFAGDDRRPKGGRDAFFVVRNPPPLDPDQAEAWTVDWLSSARDLAISVGDLELVESLDPTPAVRVLEGTPPKHPKKDEEKSGLLRAIQQNLPMLVEQLDVGPFPAVLRPAYYFIACDAILRDYLMWPFYASASGLNDPFEPYFHLWSHGAKYRIFEDGKIDIYLPRQI